MLDVVDAKDTSLLESPTGNSLGELAVPGLDLLASSRGLDLGVEPLVAQQLGRSNEGEASAVARLES